MKIFFLFFVLSSALVFSGCGASHAKPAETNASEPAAIYKAGYGLRLSPSASELTGLITMDVADRVGAHGSGLVIPVGALLRTVKGDFVYVANGGWFLRTPVTIGAADDHWVHVNDGLYAGDAVVARGVRTLWLAELQAVNGGVGCADGK